MAPRRGNNNKKGKKAAPKSSKATKSPKTPKNPKTPKTPRTLKSYRPKKTSKDVLEVNWALPKAKRRKVSDQKYINDYAYALYDREPDELQPVQTALPEAQIRAPIYQKKGGKGLQAGDANQSSAALRGLYNHIKEQSVNEPDCFYNLAVLTESFASGTDQIVVILSDAEDAEMLILGGDRRLQVSVNDQTAHIDFIRRISASDDSHTGYFIELPQGISVTVNGVTYTNDGGSSPTPFYIGPLEGYAVIELLSQPAFFFRNEESLRYTVTTRKAPADEIQRRDRNGDVSMDNVTVRWLLIEPSDAADQGDVGEPDVSSVQAREPHRKTRVEVRIPRTSQAEVPVPRSEGDELTGTRPPEPMEEHRPEDIEYSDAFTDDGLTITDPCAYVQTGLKMHTRNRIASIIPRVIAAVNHRQPEDAGFSFVHNETVFRPGRTLITALTDCGRYLLVVGQIQPDASIRIRVLYPRTWRSHKTHRDKIIADLRNWFMGIDWWRSAFDSHEQMVASLPTDIEWAPCAQTLTQDGTFTYTILNAWALAMGLEPDPKFTPIFHGNEAFFIQAERIFDLALNDSLTWKVLLAFLRCTGFVKPAATTEGENGEDDDLPVRNRRFDQRKRSFELLVADQTRADQASAGKNPDVEQMAVKLEDGLVNSALFASDSFADKDRSGIIQLVSAGEWRLKDSVKQLKQRFAELAHGGDDSSSTGSSPGFSLTETLQLDVLAVPDNFNPCEHLDEFVNMEELFYRNAGEEPPQAAETIPSGEGENSLEIPKLTKEDIQDSIAAVVRAVNRRHPPGGGFTTRSSTTEVKSSINDKNDSISISVYEASDNHNLCVMIQNPTEGARSCTIIDSGLLTIKNDARIRIRQQLRRELSVIGPIPWISGPQEVPEHHSGYHVVLNAWSIVFGLPLNIQGFKPNHKFIRDAYYVIRAVLQAEVDWLVIWALLRCHGYVASGEAPAPGRRFAKTMPSSEHDAYLSEMRSKRYEAPAQANVNFYDYFQPDPVRDSAANCDWDDSSVGDGIAGFRELQPSEYTESTASSAKSQKSTQPNENGVFAKDGITGFVELQPPSESSESVLSSSVIQESHPQPAEKFEPCKYLQSTLRVLLAGDEMRKELKKFRMGAVTTELGVWLSDDEVALSIDAVLMAINMMQSEEEGFSIVLPHDVALAEAVSGDLSGVFTDALRPGRPLITPIVFYHHTVLLVAQFNENYRPTISFLDSLDSSYDASQRERLFDQAWRILCYTSWWRNFFPTANHFNKIKPSTATWVRTARQPSSHECGYFAIMNGWALALGLEPNPDLKLRWTDSFFQQIKDVIHLARLGYADWKLIFAFLRCHNIVQDGVVPENRRFSRTHDVPTLSGLTNALDQLRNTENAYWKSCKTYDGRLKRMRNCNRVPNMKGRPHNAVFASDGWRGNKKLIEGAKRLLRFSKHESNHDTKQMSKEDGSLTRNRLENCKKRLLTTTSSKKSAREVLAEAILDEVNSQYEGMDLAIQNSPDDWVDDTIALYDEIRKDVEVRQIFGSRYVNFDLYLAMASVLEAIDTLQSDLHARSNSNFPFAGGFSLTTSFHLQRALSSQVPDENRVVSRPRRPWLFPLVLRKDLLLPQLEQWAVANEKAWKPPKGDAGGHSFLVLVQEVSSEEFNSGQSYYEIQILDSRVRDFEDVMEFFGERIEATVKSLGWSEHRNERFNPPFDPQLYLRDEVPQQVGVSSHRAKCHVLINAWIIAMGLQINQDAKLKSVTYAQLFSLSQAAIAGILDWKTLVAWLFSHDLTIENQFSAVPEDRRFGCTFRQTSETALADRIKQQYQVVDEALREFDQTDAPYNYSNNYIFEEQGDSDEEEEPGADSERGLQRRVDDADLEFFGHSRGTKRKLSEDSDASLNFLDRYEVSRRDVKRIAAHCSSAWKKQRVFGNLSFLEVY